MLILFYSAVPGRRGDTLKAALMGAAAHTAHTGEPAGVRHVRTPDGAPNVVPGPVVARSAARQGVAYDLRSRAFVRAGWIRRRVLGARLWCWRTWMRRPWWAAR